MVLYEHQSGCLRLSVTVAVFWSWRSGWPGIEIGAEAEPELEKTIVFHSCFLENSENFTNFAKSSKKFGKFLNFLEFFKIMKNSLAFSYAFLKFLEFSRML